MKKMLPGLPRPSSPDHDLIDCGACRKCCQAGIAVVLFPEMGDDPSLFDCDDPHADYPIIRHKANGDCSHLGPEGCDKWPKHPVMCRMFNCEKAALSPLVRTFCAPGGVANNSVLSEGLRRLKEKENACFDREK